MNFWRAIYIFSRNRYMAAIDAHLRRLSRDQCVTSESFGNTE
jgi:hypothetical protein